MKWISRVVPSFLIIFLMRMTAGAQEPLNPMIEAYIDMYRPLAIQEMQRTGVPAAIKIAQGILETEAGKSKLVKSSNNHFGIKCKSNWNGERVYHDDDEKGECFRKYTSPEDSYRDHSDFLKLQPRYSSLFQLDPMDYKSWAYGLKSAGYATNPKYPETLIRLIETYRLDELTYFVLNGREPRQRGDMAGSEKPLEQAKPVTASVPVAKPEQATGQAAPSVSTPAVTYPEGVFRSGGSKAVFARKGTSLLALAEVYGIRLSKLMDYNDIPEHEDEVREDRIIYLQRKRDRADANDQKKERWEPFKSMTGISSLISRRRS